MSKNLLGKLAIIQKDLKAPKSKLNSFGKYNYRSCEDILEAVKPLLSELGLVIMINDEIVFIEGRFYVKAIVTLYDTETEASLYTTAYAREAENKAGADVAQITGACSSYARKYALNAMFAIDDTKDAETDESANEASARVKAEAKATRTRTAKAESKPEASADETALTGVELVRAKYNELIKYCAENNHDIKEVAKTFGLNAKSTAEDFSTALNRLIYADSKKIKPAEPTDFEGVPFEV